ncbi:rRNA adenine N-6-methyltransferase family protein [Leptospira sp. GIMC2001]|uniref:rRNA adenine N-6-methyltransferase family protein n=1 Tax=Leptospira sp. GIMC2001 TaxID=1513297 RepID=UPI0023499317|nr:rRNA adenine N-6-methyltransferase family protein [Leptospira sp. GIMC2001]WCL50405.1 16S rRNA (adenine(1518)-N(6)/adenine(1519)-N(6))-dimethyltransferase [Leptospira sp. GIMC2001]
MIDRNIVDSIFETIPNDIPNTTESLAEIGIGLGALTHKILELNQQTYLFEIDPISCNIFREGIGHNQTNIMLYEGDCLDYLDNLNGKKSFVFGNLPYYITSEILTRCIENLEDMTGFLFLVQKEFADRIMDEVSSLSVFIRGFGTLKRYKIAKKGSFYPSPSIDSAFILWIRHKEQLFINKEQIQIFSSLLRASFWGKRKKLSTSIREAPEDLFPNHTEHSVLRKLFLDQIESSGLLDKRPQELKPEQFIRIAQDSIQQLK